MNGNQEDSINRLEKRLYNTRPVNPEKERADLRPLSQEDVKSSFEDTADISTIRDMKKSKDVQTPILRTLLIASSIFFLSALGISTYLLLGGSNIVSNDNIDVSLSGPVSVKGGDEFGLQILISNKNNISLKFAQLIVEYPEGAKPPKSDSVVPNRYIKDLGEIENNSVINETVNSVLFGEENSEQEIKVTLEYRTEGSNATFVKRKSYKTFISSSPLSLFLELPSDINADKEMDLSVKVSSNSSEVLKDVILEIAYPSGFIFKDASPSPAYGENFWVLGDLLARGERTIKLRGSMQGQDAEIKTFRASAGTRESKDDNRVTLIYGSSLKSLVVKKPFIGINIALNGNSGIDDYIVNANDTVRGNIGWTNNLPVKILNGEISVKINGEVLNKSTVSAGNGFFRSSDGVIVWNQVNGDFPKSIEPGADGNQTFSFSFLPLISGRRTILENPQLDLEVTFRGNRFGEGSGSGSVIENVIKRKIKLSSDLQLTARAVYYVGPFKNTGTLPPQADRETTYTVMWSVVNSSNNVNGVIVKAALPPYVRYVGSVSPAGENIVYNPLGGEVVWSVGDVSAGSGILTPAREVAFQVAFLPSIGQIGQYPTLVANASISGADTFTGVDTSSVRRELNIQLTTDSGVRPGEDQPVIK
ncbi:MAG: hypothetical protein Q7S19_02275 [bacterium]|nr:hypothetical protein [bacterium]